MSDDAELQARIAALAGRINRHKSRRLPQRSTTQADNRLWQPYTPNKPIIHRNRTLHVSESAQSVAQPDAAAIDAPRETFVRQRGINNQLMTKSTFDREREARSLHKQRGAHMSGRQVQSLQERQMLARHFQRATTSRVLELEGVRFEMKEDGSKLVRVADPSIRSETPRRAVIAGVEFLRTKNGNLLRKGALKSGTRYHTSNTRSSQEHGSSLHLSRAIDKKAPQCENFTKNGNCAYGDHCHFTHDPKKVAMCKDFLRKGECPRGRYCDLSHEPTYHRVSACRHFQDGRCTNGDCRYPHIRVSPGAPVCRPFAVLGYCEAGPSCEDRHVNECPDYSNTGSCSKLKKCPLPHILRASTERAAARASSDSASELDEDAGEENDLDSDDLAEDLVMAGSDEAGLSLANNDDFISLS